MRISEAFQRWLQREPAPWRIGQAVILQAGPGRYVLRHADDLSAPDAALRHGGGLAAVRAWALRAESGAYRPLKAENNLARGWSVGPFDCAGLLEALNALYPTALANAFLFREGTLRITSFEETAGRQTGMYRVVASLSAEQKARVIASLCRARCLKARLWDGEGAPPAAPSELALLCPEACNLFVAEARACIKGGAPSADGHE
jgi:hypothetical protein